MGVMIFVHLVKQITEPRLTPFAATAVVDLFEGVATGCCAWGRHDHGGFNELVEFAPVQPDPATLGAIVDASPLWFLPEKVGIRAERTFHPASGSWAGGASAPLQLEFETVCVHGCLLPVEGTGRHCSRPLKRSC